MSSSQDTFRNDPLAAHEHATSAAIPSSLLSSSRRIASTSVARTIALRDEACHLSCAFLARHRATLAPSAAPARVSAWLSTQPAQELLSDLAESLPGLNASPVAAVSGTELALGVRVAQLRLREVASAAIGQTLGQDDCVPLLEELLVVGTPKAAHSVRLPNGL